MPWGDEVRSIVSDVVDLDGHSADTVSISGTAAASSALDKGVYDVWADANCYLAVAEDPTSVTTGNGYLLRANNTITIAVEDQRKIGVIGTSGTLTFHRVG